MRNIKYRFLEDGTIKYGDIKNAQLFTGFKDIKGRDIFENDILIFSPDNFLNISYIKIVYQKNGFYVYPIGNTYQHLRITPDILDEFIANHSMVSGNLEGM